jgi:hypothetical protein
MKVIIGTSIVPTTLFIIFFLTIIYFTAMQFAYAQTVENEIIENTLETVEKATAGNSEISSQNTTIFSRTEQIENIPTIKKENLSHSIYENNEMGIKVKFPSLGNVKDYTFDTNNCEKEFCIINILLNSSNGDRTVTISSTPLNFIGQMDNIVDDMKDHYLFRINSGFKYINDNQTIVAGHPAIQMEYNLMGTSTLLIKTQNGDSFYTIDYEEKDGKNINENKKIYAEHLPEVKEIINSIEFIKDFDTSMIPEEVVPFSTNTTLSTERGYPSFINNTDLTNPEIMNEINNTLNFRERYDEFVFDNSTIGIKFAYPSNWDLQLVWDLENCYKDLCKILLQESSDFYSNISRSFLFITSIPLNEYYKVCNCTNIQDYVKSIYDNEWGENSDGNYEFVNNNITLIDNHTAIQMEFIGKKGSENENRHYVFLITQVDNIFYRFDYLIDDEVYRKYPPQVKKIIDSIQFIQMDKPKLPSFM